MLRTGATFRDPSCTNYVDFIVRILMMRWRWHKRAACGNSDSSSRWVAAKRCRLAS